MWEKRGENVFPYNKKVFHRYLAHFLHTRQFYPTLLYDASTTLNSCVTVANDKRCESNDNLRKQTEQKRNMENIDVMLSLVLIMVFLFTLAGLIQGYWTNRRINQIEDKFSKKLQTFKASLKKGLKINLGSGGSQDWQSAVVDGVSKIAAGNPKLQGLIDTVVDKVMPDEKVTEEELENL